MHHSSAARARTCASTPRPATHYAVRQHAHATGAGSLSSRALYLFIYLFILFFYVRERESETGTARRCGLSSWFGLCSHALDVLDVNMCERAATRDTDVTQIVRYLNIFVILFYLQITQILNEMCTCQTKS